MDNVNQILIENYLEGKLTAQEKADFELRLTKDSELAKQYADLQDFMIAMQSFGRNELKQELQAIADMEALPADIFEQSTQKKTRESDVKVRKISYRKLISIAAVILIITVPTLMLLNKQKMSPEELYQSYFEVYPNVAAPIVRSESPKNSLEQAMAIYEQKDYKGAIDKLQKIKVETKDKEAVGFYLAMAYLANGNTNQAIEKFQKLQQQSLATYQDQTTWYLALAFLSNKELEKSKTQLIKLSKKDSFYKNKATKLLKSL